MSVAGDHRDVEAVCVQGVDGLPGLLARRVLQGDGPDHLMAFDHVEDRGASLGPAAGPGCKHRGYVGTEFLEEPGAADRDPLTVHDRLDATSRQGSEVTGVPCGPVG